MNVLRGTVLLVLAGASAAGAQNKSCKIDDGKPFQLASARIYLQKAATGKAADEKPKHLQSSLRVLTENADKIGNPVGRNWLIGRTLVQWIELRPEFSFTAKRGELGFATDPQGTVNILAAMDSAFSVVEQQAPECTDTTTRYRRSVWSKIVNHAQTQLTASQIDSAEYYANQSLYAYRRAPNAPYILASVAIQRNDVPAQLRFYEQTIQMAGMDTMYTKIRRQAMYNVAVIKNTQAEAATGDQQKTYYREAANLFQTYLKEDPTNPNAQQGLARALTALGDTTAAMNVYGEMLATPEKFSDVQLFEAGVSAYNAKKYAESAKLYEAGLAKNPYDRTGLANAATTYFALRDADRMSGVISRLMEIDPNNPDNLRLKVAAFQIRQRASTDEKLNRALGDSVLKYLELEKNAPIKVSVQQFAHNNARHTLVGSVENRSKAAATYKINFEFLDKDGKVIARQTQNVGPVNPGESKAFTLNVVQSGIVAYRYAPIS
ncbi:MAG TPA: tetratricopeptide repeat protein [Gemmatimonadaceae bacterium]|nr:tetratricopeptide repeat protein [Gemmatimonadaceae bacterium]